MSPDVPEPGQSNDFSAFDYVVRWHPEALEAVILPGSAEARVASHHAGVELNAAESEPTRIACVRARSTIRRYAVANRLTGLMTCTFADEPEVDGARQARKTVVRRMRKELGNFPYVFVAEGVHTATRLHLHALLSESSSTVCSSLWDWGSVQIEQLAGAEDIARASSYICKEFDKTSKHETRYSSGRGFTPEQRSWATNDSLNTTLALLADKNGRTPSEVLELPNGGLRALFYN